MISRIFHLHLHYTRRRKLGPRCDRPPPRRRFARVSGSPFDVSCARVLRRRDVRGSLDVRTAGGAGIRCRSSVRWRLCRLVIAGGVHESLLGRREWQIRSGALVLSACTLDAHGRTHSHRVDRSPRSALPARSRITKRAATSTTGGTTMTAANSLTSGSWTRTVRSGGLWRSSGGQGTCHLCRRSLCIAWTRTGSLVPTALQVRRPFERRDVSLVPPLLTVVFFR